MKPTLENIAKVCHEANRAYCLSLGDDSQLSWEEAPDWQKQSAYNGVVFHYNNHNAGPEASHNSWYQEKELDGWLYGEVKDVENKKHPCMVPYDELPVEQKAKDYIFCAIVKSMKVLT